MRRAMSVDRPERAPRDALGVRCDDEQRHAVAIVRDVKYWFSANNEYLAAAIASR